MSHDAHLRLKYHTAKINGKVGKVRKETETKKGNFEEEKSAATKLGELGKICIVHFATTKWFVPKEANLKVSGV